MRGIRLLWQAAEEAEAAAAWYESEREGLGAEFAEAIEAALDLVEDGLVPLSPMPGHAGLKGAKRVVLRRFPYDIVVIGSEQLFVVAFAHHSRKPGYWRERLDR